MASLFVLMHLVSASAPQNSSGDIGKYFLFLLEFLADMPDTRDMSKTERYIIQDWTGKRLFPEQTFATFEDGWAFIYEHFDGIDDEPGFYDEFYVMPEES